MARYLGLDIGSISINTVLIDDDLEVVVERYDYCHGRPFHVLRDVLEAVTANTEVAAIATSGSGGRLASELIGGHFANEIVSPGNANSCVELSGGHPTRFRLRAWRGIVGVYVLRRMLSQTRPYERSPGAAHEVYRAGLDKLVHVIESGGRNYRRVLKNAAAGFRSVRDPLAPRKPIIAIVGEIFMRDNPFCNGYVESRLEALGAETVMAPVYEWLSYSTYRYTRDSVWKRDARGWLKSKPLDTIQNTTGRALLRTGKGYLDEELDLHLHEMLQACEPYIHHHCDGDKPLTLGTAAALAKRGIAGVADILPFTCQPGTLISAVAGELRHDHLNLPWVDVANDGQEDAGIDTRLQAFMHQAYEFRKMLGESRAGD